MTLEPNLGLLKRLRAGDPLSLSMVEHPRTNGAH
jgi:hypothetical protein